MVWPVTPAGAVCPILGTDLPQMFWSWACPCTQGNYPFDALCWFHRSPFAELLPTPCPVSDSLPPSPDGGVGRWKDWHKNQTAWLGGSFWVSAGPLSHRAQSFMPALAKGPCEPFCVFRYFTATGRVLTPATSFLGPEKQKGSEEGCFPSNLSLPPKTVHSVGQPGAWFCSVIMIAFANSHFFPGLTSLRCLFFCD